STGRQRRVYRFHLLDVSAGEHGLESETENERGGIFTDAGAGANFFGQHRKHSELVGDAGTGDRASGTQIWSQRFWERDDGRKRGQQRGDDISPGCKTDRIAYSRRRLRTAPAQQLV